MSAMFTFAVSFVFGVAIVTALTLTPAILSLIALVTH